MDVRFYRNYSDNRYLSKSISALGSIYCHIKEKCSIENPTITIDRKNLASISQTNYAFVPDFNRYYFIDNIRLVTAQRAEIEMSVDVLMSYKSNIYNLNGVIQRQEFLNNKYIQDEQAPLRAEKVVEYKAVGMFPTEESYILTVDGGSQS